MIGNKLEQSMISVFQTDPARTYSINEIAKALKKSYPYINQKANYFLKEGVLKKIDIGKSYQCYLDLHNEKTKILLTINEINRKEHFLSDKKVIEQETSQLISKFNIKNIIYYKENIFFITELDFKEKILETTILQKSYKLFFISTKEFKDLYKNDPDLQKYHMVLGDATQFIDMVSELHHDMIVQRLFKNEK